MFTPLNISLDCSGSWDRIFSSRIRIHDVVVCASPSDRRDRLWCPVKWWLYNASWNRNTGFFSSLSNVSVFVPATDLGLRTNQFSIATTNATVPMTQKCVQYIDAPWLHVTHFNHRSEQRQLTRRKEAKRWSFSQCESTTGCLIDMEAHDFPAGYAFFISSSAFAALDVVNSLYACSGLMLGRIIRGTKAKRSYWLTYCSLCADRRHELYIHHFTGDNDFTVIGWNYDSKSAQGSYHPCELMHSNICHWVRSRRNIRSIRASGRRHGVHIWILGMTVIFHCIRVESQMLTGGRIPDFRATKWPDRTLKVVLIWYVLKAMRGCKFILID